MKRICFISRNYRNTDSAGNKAKTDNEDTLQLFGAHNLGLHRTLYPNKIITFFIDLAGVIKYCFTIKAGDIVLLQYPVKKYFAFLCHIAKCRGAQTIALIHDLGSFRRRKLTVEKEINRLMKADYVIASNGMMKQWLTEHGYSHPLGQLDLFDYRSTAENKTLIPSSNGQFRLVYAGALAMRKNAFLLELAKKELPYELHIFGNRSGLPTLQDNTRIIFHPFTPADEFISNVEGDFGLVWDGDSLDSCTGNFGEYLRWNSPHKVSFYIRAGLPILIWKHAAVAPILEAEGIGIGIESLADLPTILNGMTNERMNAMRENVRRVSDQLRNGHFLQRALQQAIETLDNKNASES